MDLEKLEKPLRNTYKRIEIFTKRYPASIFTFFLVVVAGLLVIGIKFKLLTFPFEAAIWGSVSDWGMIFVTGITAVFLYKTLRSQANLFRLEQIRHRHNIIPKFTFDFPDTDNQDGSGRKTVFR